MTPSRLLLCVGACVALVASGEVCAADPLKDAGLSKSGDVYVLADETPVVDGVKALRVAKVQADKESKARKVIELQITTKKKGMKDADKEWHELETKLGVITDVGIHNRVVTRMNRLVADHKQAMADVKDLEEQAGKVSTVAKTKFVDDVAALAPKADAVDEKYKALGDDAGVKAELAKVKGTAGPSALFTAAAADLKKWQSEVESEAIPLREEGGIHLVDVQINGEHFVMGVDTGASSISLPGEVAEKLNMIPGEQDPVVRMQLADGNIIEGREMSIKTVRVGRFTLEEVRCVVLNKGLPNPPLILGGSFLNHFIVKLDPATRELHLTEVKEEGQVKVSPGGPKGAGKSGEEKTTGKSRT